MGERWRLILALGVLLSLVYGCQRDGYECQTDDECFVGEACVEQACVAACQPETDVELCQAESDCGMLEVTDRCGTSRELNCPCGNNGENFCPAETDSELCAATNAECGSLTVTDSCEDLRSVDCGPCTGDDVCIENTCAPCAPPTCPTEGTACGVVTNACGEQIDCGGSCAGDQLCIDNVCGPPVLAPAELAAEARFGEEIRATPTRVAIGAVGAGEIWIYDRHAWGWERHQTLAAPVSGTGFGAEFDLNEQFLIVATSTALLAYEPDSNEQYALVGQTALDRPVRDISLRADNRFLIGFEEGQGLATLFIGTCTPTGCELGTSWVPEPTDEGQFGLGYSVDSAGEFSVAGAPFDDIAAGDEEAAGSIYFVSDVNNSGNWPATGWTDGLTYFKKAAHIDIPGDTYTQGIGHSVAMSADGLAITGAPFDYPATSFDQTGGVFLFGSSASSPWSRGTRIAGPKSELFARCGQAVAIAGGQAVASCVHTGQREDTLLETEVAQTLGSLYRWTWSSEEGQWTLDLDPVTLPDPDRYDHFGWALEGTSTDLYAGAPGRNSDAGEVWLYPVD